MESVKIAPYSPLNAPCPCVDGGELAIGPWPNDAAAPGRHTHPSSRNAIAQASRSLSLCPIFIPPLGRAPKVMAQRNPGEPRRSRHAQHLTRLMGRGTALEVMLSAQDYSAELAERYGWITEPCPRLSWAILSDHWLNGSPAFLPWATLQSRTESMRSRWRRPRTFDATLMPLAKEYKSRRCGTEFVPR
jgi:hypothetical protein